MLVRIISLAGELKYLKMQVFVEFRRIMLSNIRGLGGCVEKLKTWYRCGFMPTILFVMVAVFLLLK